MKFISSINAYLIEESDIKNRVLYLNEINGPNCKLPSFIATDDVQHLCDKIVFGDKVTEIPKEAFYLWNIKEIELGKNTKSIGESAFDSCLLKKVNTKNVVTIAENAFANNDELEEVYLGKNLTYIGSFAFSQNSKLKKVVIDPENTYLSTIPSFCFRDDTNLETVENLNVSNLESFAFSGCKKLKVTVPQQTITKNGHYSIIDCKREFSFDADSEVTILVEDYNADLRNVVEKLKETGIMVKAIPVSKKAAKQLFPICASPEETALKKAQKLLTKINKQIPQLNEEILALTIKVNNLPHAKTEPVELGKTSIKL